MDNWYNISKEETLERLHTSVNGLTENEASKIRSEKGENVLQEEKKKSLVEVFLLQFKDLLVIILIVAAIVSMLSGNVESTIVIFVVIIMNAVLGTVQHAKAQKSLEGLKSLSSPNAKVLRDGQKIEIPSKLVVPGDIVLLEAGDLVVADGRILGNYSLEVDESSLTGESLHVDKKDIDLEGEVALGDRDNMVFSGSLVTYGRADIVVTETGMNTEIGKIATLMNSAKERKTPLQVSLDQFSGKLAILIMVICAAVFGLSLFRKMPILDALMFAVALAVAAIPEALGSIVTIVQAMGTQKMAKEHAIIKDLKAVESLGCVSVICSDKTGTLTQNKMTVQDIYLDDKTMHPQQLNMKNQLHRYLLYDAILTNDSAIVDGKGIGDPTEYSLLEMYRMVMESKPDFTEIQNEESVRASMERSEEIPFDSDRKLMSTKYALHGEPTVLTKGAVDVLLDRCTHVRKTEGIVPMTKEEKKNILAANTNFSENGLRVLAFAYKECTDELNLESEKDFIFLGLISMMDPPRPESVQAVADAKGAGIRPVMITGDHKVTATAIAKQIGIFEEGNIAVTGMELDAMSHDELEEKIENITVYARVSPENKIRIVEAWQEKGFIVSMTGDGVNDAPALKKADIGVAMGITGTEVSKDAASMILSDDNFATIIKAVANGRNVYRNIRNSILFLLSGNMAGILAVLYTSIAGLAAPFVPVHLLFINLLTDSLPAIAIGMEPAERDLLSDRPRPKDEGILTKEFLMKIFVQGAFIAGATMCAYYIGRRTNAATASTMAFATLTLARLFHGFNCRSKHSIFKIGFRKNWYSLGAFVVGVLLLSAVIFLPFMHKLFCVEDLVRFQTGMIVLLAVIPTVIIQFYKVVKDVVSR